MLKSYQMMIARLGDMLRGAMWMSILLWASGAWAQDPREFVVTQPNGESETFIVSGVGTTNYDGYNFPTGIYLSSQEFGERNATGQSITLTATDPDIWDTHEFGFVEGDGSADNDAFTISGNRLIPVVSFDYDEKKTYSVRIAAVDLTGLSYVQSFTPEHPPRPPTNILLSATEIEENQPAGTLVGKPYISWSRNWGWSGQRRLSPGGPQYFDQSNK